MLLRDFNIDAASTRNADVTSAQGGPLDRSRASDTADPAAWTRQTCAAWVAAVDRMNVGDDVHRTTGLEGRVGKPLTASTKDGEGIP